jgi:nitrogen-specific signal transduction histidine kinase
MLGVTNRGTGRLPALGDRTVLPFSDTAPGTRAAGSREPAMRIGLPLSQRLLQQHGGQMRIGADAHDDTTVVVLELPTGASCRVSQLDSEQAQRFAADPAKMTAASRGLRAAAAEQAARRETRR